MIPVFLKGTNTVKTASIDYIEKAKELSHVEQERLLSRMVGKLPKRLRNEKVTLEEAFAIQLELEDEQLHEWRENMAVIKEKTHKQALKAAEKLANQKLLKSKAKLGDPTGESTVMASEH